MKILNLKSKTLNHQERGLPRTTFFRKSDKGFTMIELIVTISILSVGIIGSYSAFSSINSLTHSISPRLTAVYLAQEGQEIVRNIRDSNYIDGKNWKFGLSNCKNGCQADYKAGTDSESNSNKLKNYSDDNFLILNADGFYGYEEGIKTIFKRKITIDNISNSSLKVDVLVMWDYQGKSFEFKTESYLYDWY